MGKPNLSETDIGRMEAERDVEGLIRALKHKDWSVRSTAAQTLGKIKDARAVKPLIQVLKDKDRDIQRTAIESLEKIGEPAIEPLIHSLMDEDQNVQKFVAQILGGMGDKRAVEPLIQALKNEDPEVKWSVRRALLKLTDEKTVDPLIQALRDEDPNIRMFAIRLLAKIRESPIEPLIQALKDEDEYVRGEAVRTLGDMGDKQAMGPLMQALKDESKYVREEAAKALREIGDKRVIEPLRLALKDESRHVRILAAHILREMGDEQIIAEFNLTEAGVKKRETAKDVEGLINALEISVDPKVRSIAAEALSKIGDSRSVGPLIQALKYECKEVRRCIATALGDIGDARAVEPLIEELKNITNEVVNALAKIGDKRAVEPLIQAVRNGNYSLRMEAARGLGKLKDTRAVEPLIQALKDKNWQIRRSMAWALGELEDSKAIEPLIQALKDKDKYVREKVAEALGKIKDARALEPLIHALNDEHLDVRWAAAEALGKIKDTRAVNPLVQGLKNICLWFQTILDYQRKIYHPEKMLWAIGEMGEPAVEPLLQALKDNNSIFRLIVAEALERIGWQPKNDTERIQYHLAKQEWDKLVEVGKPAVEYLIQALKDKETSVRMEAAKSLSKIGDVSAIPFLINTLKDENFNIREEAVRALENIGGLAVEQLIRALEYEDWKIRWGAARTLGEIKDKRAVEPLKQALNDKNGEARMAAAMSLNKITGEKVVISQDQAIKDKLGMDEFERLNLTEKILNNYAQYEAYSGADYCEDYQKFNPIKYDEIMQKIRDNPNISLWDFISRWELFEDAIKELYNYMKTGEKRVRICAIEVYTNIQDKVRYPVSDYSEEWNVHNELNKKKYWDFFIETMGEEDPEIRNAAEKAIEGFPIFFKFPRIYHLLDSENPHIREGARYVLVDAIRDAWHEEGFPFYEYLKQLIKAAGQKDDYICKEAAFILTGLEEQYFSDFYAQQLKENPNDWIRELSSEMLKYQMHIEDEAYDALNEALLKDPSPRVRRKVAETVGDFYWALEPEELPEPEENPFIDSLAKALSDEDQSVREASLEALGAFGVKESFVNTLAEVLKDSTKTESKKPLELFLSLLDSEKWYIRRLAIFSLGHLKDKSVIDTLKNLLNDKSTGIREAAIIALGSFSPEHVLENITSTLNDPKPYIRIAAVRALTKMGGDKAVEPLIRTLYDKNHRIRYAAVQALKKMKDKRAIYALEHVAENDEVRYIQNAAKHALEKIEEKKSQQ